MGFDTQKAFGRLQYIYTERERGGEDEEGIDALIEQLVRCSVVVAQNWQLAERAALRNSERRVAYPGIGKKGKRFRDDSTERA